jgi:hypothetical protein
MSGLTASNVSVVCGVVAVTRTRNALKRAIQHQYRHAATASWWTQRNLMPPNVEAAGMPKKRCEGESCRERQNLQREGCSLPAAPPQDYPSRRCYRATHSNSSSLSHPQLHRPALALEAQPTSTNSVQTPDANSSSLNDMFTAVETVFQQIVTELNGAETEKGRIKNITKTLIKTYKARWLLEFTGGKYDCNGESQQQ